LPKSLIGLGICIFRRSRGDEGQRKDLATNLVAAHVAHDADLAVLEQPPELVARLVRVAPRAGVRGRTRRARSRPVTGGGAAAAPPAGVARS